MNTTDPITYTCDECGQTFERPEGWTHRERVAESLKLFGAEAVEAFATGDVAVVCDECFQAIKRRWNL